MKRRVVPWVSLPVALVSTFAVCAPALVGSHSEAFVPAWCRRCETDTLCDAHEVMRSGQMSHDCGARARLTRRERRRIAREWVLYAAGRSGRTIRGGLYR